MRQIAQIVPTDAGYLPTKCSLHLTPTGAPVDYFTIDEDGNAQIDATNFNDIIQGEFFFVYDDREADYTDDGYIECRNVIYDSIISRFNQTVAVGTPGDLDGNGVINISDLGLFALSPPTTSVRPTAEYRFKGTRDGKHTVHLRIFATYDYNIELSIDNVVFETVSGVASGGWIWVSADLVVFDDQVHTLGVSPSTTGILIDKIEFSDSTPTGEGTAITESPFVTVHTRLTTVNTGIPVLYYPVLSFHTTADTISKTGWYNFAIDYLYDGDAASQVELAVVVSTSGGSPTHYIVWDTAQTIASPIAENTGSGWVADDTVSMAIRVYSDRDFSADEYCELVTPEATLEALNIGDFNDLELRYHHENTVFVPDEYGGDDVELDLGEKALSFIVDQSGSMSWNDHAGSRFQISEQLLDTLQSRYPADLRFNLFETRGEQTFSMFVPLKRKPDKSTIAEIVKTYFENDSDYFAGIRVVRKKDGYSESFIDGEIVNDGYAVAALDVDLEEDTDYYYTVYTYDQKLRPSRGVQIPARTREKVIPRGLPNISTRVLTGYDITANDNTLALWNMDEGEGNYVYDFGNSGVYLTASNHEWLDFYGTATGVSGLRFNGFTSKAETTVTTAFDFALTDQFTITFWVNPFDTSASDSAIIVNGKTGSIKWAVDMDSGNIVFTMDATFAQNYFTSTPINEDEWTHIAIVYDNGTVSIYFNGVSQTVTQAVGTVAGTSGGNNISIGTDQTGFIGNDFFGKLTHVGIHDTALSATEVLAIATPSKGFTEDGDPQPVDNGDRLVVFDYVVPDDADYDTIRIVRNAMHMPSFETDGDIVAEIDVTVGDTTKYTFGAAYPYDVAHNYYFRAFTRNAEDNWCHIEDATKIEVFIPDVSRPEITVDVGGDTTTFVPGPGASSDVPIISNVVMRNGNDKVYFTWDAPSDPASRVAIYYSTERCPRYDAELMDIVDGAIIFDGTLDITEFVHRKVGNRKPGYYLIVPRDRFNRFNNGFACHVSFPREDYDDSGIPLLEVTNVSWHLDDYDCIRITWDSPVSTANNTDGWFDEKFYVYMAICDLYGNPIPFAFPDGLKVTSTLSADIEQVEDVFNLGTGGGNIQNLPVSSFNVFPDGLVAGILRLRPSNALTNVKKLSVSLSATYTLSSKFSYRFVFGLGSGVSGQGSGSTTGTIDFKNPLEMRLVNRDSLYLQTPVFVPPKGCDTNDDEGGEGKPESPGRKRVNGTFIRRKQPFAIRAIYTYKGVFIPSAAVSVKIFDATGGPCGITPQLSTTSRTVVLASRDFRTQLITTPIFGPDGLPTGATDRVSFSDILLKAPFLPQSASTYVLVRVNGYSRMKKMHIFFPSTLRLELTAAAPLANNLDVREEFAKAYFIDPDNPGDLTRISLVPNNTVAKWKLLKGGVASTGVPFYSSDSVPLTNGVYSYFRSGIARQVFFGPADTKAAGEYILIVSVTASGLFSEVRANLKINARTGGGTDFPPVPDPTLPRIFCEFPNCVNYLWADGNDYQRLTIYRNPTSAATTPDAKYDDKFRECSEALYALPVNTTVSIDAPGYEIVSGDVSETNIGGRCLDTANATINVDSAVVNLGRDPYTYVYFRKNAEVVNKNCRAAGIDSCVCYDPPDDICYQPYGIGIDTDVIVHTKVNISGKPRTIYGGGGRKFDGRPPTILVPLEPLYLACVGLFVFRNSIETPVNEFVFDGVTTNYVYFELRYAGHAVPSNTQVAVKVVADREELNGVPVMEALNIPDKVFSFTTSILPGGTELDTPTSLVKVPVGPISPDDSIQFLVYVETTYSEDLCQE